MRVYLATPVDSLLQGGRIQQMKEEVWDALEFVKHALFNPASAYTTWQVAQKEANFVKATNLAALKMCDVLVILWSKDEFSIGVWLELEVARAEGKWIIIHTDDEARLRKSIYFCGETEFTRTLPELKTALLKASAFFDPHTERRGADGVGPSGVL